MEGLAVPCRGTGVRREDVAQVAPSRRAQESLSTRQCLYLSLLSVSLSLCVAASSEVSEG